MFGSADDFYRIRVLRVDIPDELEWEWRDDVLWRRIPEGEHASTPRFRIQAVTKDTSEALTLAEVESAASAREVAEAADEDLALLTKRQFDARYGIGQTFAAD